MKVIYPDGNASTIDSFSFDSTTDILRLQSAGVVQPDPEPEPEPEQPDPEIPEVPDGVITFYEFDPMKDESNKRVLVNPTGTIASKFTAPAKGYGSIMFEFDPTVPGGYKTIRAWISETPGGTPIEKSEKVNAMMLNISWALVEHRTKVKLVAGRTYYLNLQHANAEEHGSRLFRFIKPGTAI